MPSPGDAKALRLSAFETATRLSCLLWATSPTTIFSMPPKLASWPHRHRCARAEQMLADERGARAIQDFYLQWGRVTAAPSHKYAAALTPQNGDLIPTPDPTKTLPQQHEVLTGATPCKACHDVINPLGFAFDHFDTAGRFRAKDRGAVMLNSKDDAKGSFADQVDLASRACWPAVRPSASAWCSTGSTTPAGEPRPARINAP